MKRLSLVVALVSLAATAAADDLPDLIDRVKPSVVTITFEGRDGRQQGMGSGFAIDATDDGGVLIATNHHVLGQSRPIFVDLPDGSRHRVEEVHATDAAADLAVLEIADVSLPALSVDRDAGVRAGEEIAVIGHPLGRRYTVGKGIVSAARREVAGREMIQLAVPVEQGNSGGPVLDAEGRVIGLLTLKSLEEDDLGYAVPVAALRSLLENPNPTAMSRWLTVGRLDPRRWEYDADSNVRWRQRAGRVIASGVDRSRGTRSLCLSTVKLPGEAYEVAADVKLEDADGAAGLVFAVDDQDRHYGFYPSSGNLRLVRFDGPTIYQWDIARDKQHPAYRPGEWNVLRIRVTPNRIECFCNDEPVFELDDATYRGGQAGLVKFRHTTVAFRRFRVGDSLPASRPDDALVDALTMAVRDWRDGGPREAVVDVATQDGRSGVVLEDIARELERDATRLRALADDIRADGVRERLVTTLRSDAGDRLLRAGLLLAALDSDEVDVDASLEQFAAMADELGEAVAGVESEAAKRKTLDRLFFREWGFHGGKMNYRSRSNSYLNEALDDREGLPITLSVLYAAFAKTVGLNVTGVGLPGHFVVRYRPEEADSVLLDIFDGGREMSLREAAGLVMDGSGRPLMLTDLGDQSDRAIAVRMLRNLLSSAEREGDEPALLRYAKTLVELEPESATDRLYLAVRLFNAKQFADALTSVDAVLEMDNSGVSVPRVLRLRRAIEERM